MGRSTTRIQNLTKVTSVADDDVIPIGPASGDRAKGVVFSTFLTQLGGSTNIVEVTGNYAVTVTDDYVAVTGDPTSLTTLPLLADKAVTIKAIFGTITVSPSAGTIDGQTTIVLTIDQSLTVFPILAGWAII